MRVLDLFKVYLPLYLKHRVKYPLTPIWFTMRITRYTQSCMEYKHQFVFYRRQNTEHSEENQKAILITPVIVTMNMNINLPVRLADRPPKYFL